MSIFNSTIKSIPCQSNNMQYSRQCRCLNHDQNHKVLGLLCAVLCRSATPDMKMEKWKTEMSLNITIAINELIFYSSISMMK